MYFYSHIVKMEDLFVKLEEVELKDEHRVHLSILVDSTIHHTVLDLVLSNLGKEDKMAFIEMFRQNPADVKIMEFLSLKIDNAEGKIIETIKRMEKEFIEDIERLKNE